jgi:single-strand DNA-binding protein
MQGINKVVLIGNVGQDPETKQFESGAKMAKFSLATNEIYKKDGEKTTNTEWHRVITFKKTADVVEQYVKKGDSLYVEGKLQTRSWEDDSGNKKYMTEIVAFSIQMLGGKSSEQSQEQNGQAQQNNNSNLVPEQEDNLPF